MRKISHTHGGGSGGSRAGSADGKNAEPTPDPANTAPLYNSRHMAKATVLVVDDEQLIRWSLVERLSQDGYKTLEADTGAAALVKLSEGVDLVLLDYRLPDTDGLEVLKEVRRREPDVLVILLTAFSNVATAVEIMKEGAYHYATKPFNLDEVAVLVEKALETTRLRREVRSLRANQAQPWGIDKIVGGSPAMQQRNAQPK